MGIDKELASYTERLGNLILLEKPLNKQAGNLSFEEKKQFYLQSLRSEVKLLAAEPQWTLESISQRQSKLAELAVKAWPLPQGS